MQTRYRISPLWRRLPSVGLATLVLAHVGCADDEQSVASAQIEPMSLRFGDVSFAERRTASIRVTSNGSAPYRAASVELSGDDASFLFESDALLGAELAPGQTSTISVTYVPCPAAWLDDQLRPNFDFGTCPTAMAVAELAISDNSGEVRRVSISGTPALQPSASVECPPAESAVCNDATIAPSACGTISFGEVNAAQNQPCDIPIDVQNAKRDGASVGTLRVEKIEVLVQDLDARRTVDGESVGFQILDADRQPVRITPDTPLEVSIPDDADEGSTRFWLRYSGTVPGLWRGAESLGTGLRLTTNDPDNPTITVSILAASNAPNIDVIPDFFNFDGSVQGLTSTATITVRNTGSAPLTIRGISLRSDSSEFEWAVASNETFPLTLDVLEALPVVIRYTPVDAGNDLAFVEIASDDPDSDPIQVELRGGATPRIRVDPPDVLIFPAAPTSARDERVFVCNVGDAPLAITALNLVPVSEQSTSLDDFSVVSPDCAVLPCSVDLELCAPGTAGCSDSCENLTIRYANNDQSSVDEVNFVISSNDPGDPEHRLAFRANDVPCLFPRP
ncbi:MAG: choice-of-anchor D domain-containing protein, partial [Myxococcota bacterium]